jgi:hypothetical protein
MVVVSRSLIGTVSGALFVLALTAFALGVIDPGFRPLAIGSVLFGSVVAVLLSWRARRVHHPSIAAHTPEPEEKRPIEPK